MQRYRIIVDGLHASLDIFEVFDIFASYGNVTRIFRRCSTPQIFAVQFETEEAMHTAAKYEHGVKYYGQVLDIYADVPGLELPPDMRERFRGRSREDYVFINEPHSPDEDEDEDDSSYTDSDDEDNETIETWETVEPER